VDGAAEFLKWLSLAIFSTGINALVARAFTAMQAIRQAFIYQISLNALLFVLIWILTGSYGAIGYPYAVVITGLINFVLMYILCRFLFSGFDYLALIKFTGLLVIINGLIAIPLFYATEQIPVAGWLRLGLCFFVYLFLCLVLKNKLLKPADQHS